MTGVRHLGSVREEDGQIAILTAGLVLAVVFLFLLGLDVGNWYVHHRHLQTQADAAALAGGAHFADCFSSDAGVAAAANTTIENAALEYGGGPGSAYNAQVGGGSARVHTLFNSKTFYRGSYNDADVETQGPCQTPHYMLDVKQTEIDVPYILGGMMGGLLPAINARARVALKKAIILQGSLPLAVPDVDPSHVSVTYVNEATGAIVAGPYELAKGASAGGLNYWSGSGSLTVPAGDTKIGVRIGLGHQPPTCAAANGTGGTGFVCYDYTNTGSGLALIDGVGSGGDDDNPEPRVWATTLCAPSGGPFFGGQNIIAPSTTCSASVQAVLQTATGFVSPAKKKTFTATVNGVTKDFNAPPAGSNTWSTGYVFPLTPDLGGLGVDLVWQSNNPGSRKQTYAGVQRLFSAFEDDSGPVKELALSTSTATAGAPYTLSPGNHTITVTVGVEGSLDLSLASQTTMLRLTGGSRSSAIACDGTGAAEFRNSIINGCKTPYQINSAGFCPDPTPPPGPADCVPTKTGTTAGPTLQGLDARFAGCPPITWPDWDDSDPRVVKLIITDFSALGGSGTTDVPVTNFAGFYITGWTGSTCGNNDPPPPNVDIKKGAIWGHFIKYVAPDPFSGGTETCDPLALTPCIPVLLK
jgi:Putative Flp pilus-assembly TadE/G-like